MKLVVEHADVGKVVIRPDGRLDADTSAEFKQEMQKLVQAGVRQMVADLQNVSFMDSSGLSALVSGLKALRQKDGMLHLTGVKPQVQTALRLTMLDRVFPTFATVAEALTAFK